MRPRLNFRTKGEWADGGVRITGAKRFGTGVKGAAYAFAPLVYPGLPRHRAGRPAGHHALPRGRDAAAGQPPFDYAEIARWQAGRRYAALRGAQAPVEECAQAIDGTHPPANPLH